MLNAELSTKGTRAFIDGLLIGKCNPPTREDTMKYHGISIVKRTDAKTWYARYREEGIQKRVSGKTQQDVLEKLKIVFNVQRKPKIKAYTLNMWIDQWLKLHKQNNRETTLKAFQSIRNKYFTTQTFDTDINKIGPLELRELLENVPYERQKQKIYVILKDIFDKAIKDKITQNNPMEHIEKPKHEKKHGESLSITEQARFIEFCRTDPKYTIFLVQMYQGLRIGEALALKWNKVDFENKLLTINESINEGTKDTSTKNKASNRVMPLFNNTIELLQNIKKEDERIFNIPQKKIYKIFKEINTELNKNYKTHYLRHTFITNCKDKNIAEHIIQSWVGHSIGSKITSQTYTHKLSETELKSIEIINQTGLKPNSNRTQKQKNGSN